MAAEGGSGSSLRLAQGPGTDRALGSSCARSIGLGAELDCARAAFGTIAANAAANPLDVKTRRFMTTSSFNSGIVNTAGLTRPEAE